MADGTPEEDGRPLIALDEAQLAAVTTPSTLVAVIAAAGSGKTRVLTRRIAHRVELGTADARHTLALTFTREAAGELRRRLRRLGLREPVEAGTFHAVARGLLWQRWRDLGRDVPTVLDDRARYLREVAPNDPVTVLGTELEWAAARGIVAERYVSAARDAHRSTAVAPERIAEVMTAYQRLKRNRGVIDLDDLLGLTVGELSSDAGWADGVRWRFRHLLVDEAQDLNPAQDRLLRLLTGDRGDLFLVGDPAQAIYGFNGADPALLVDVAARFPGVEVIHLPTNHRSTPQVVNAGMHVLRVTGQPAEARSGRGDGPPLEVHGATDADAEAELVARIVDALDPGIARRGDVGVLARTNAQLPHLKRALEHAGAPLHRRALAPGTALAAAARAAGMQKSTTRLRAWAMDHLDADLDDVDDADETYTAERRMASAVLDYLREQPAGDGAGLRTWLAVNSPFESADTTGVEVLTFHGAKGREWHTVVVTGAETGLVPHRSATTIGSKEEEARLLHVALTRATDRLFVTWAARRGGYARRRSPFLDGLASGAPPAVPMPAELRPPPALRDPRLERLDEWRRRAARGVNVMPGELCTDAQLAAIATTDPATAAQLAEVTGLGELTATRLLPGIRRALDAAQASSSRGGSGT